MDPHRPQTVACRSCEHEEKIGQDEKLTGLALRLLKLGWQLRLGNTLCPKCSGKHDGKRG